LISTVRPALAIHGGAGTIPESELSSALKNSYHSGLQSALRSGWQVLASDGAALDAVIAAVTVLENDPLFNAARGAVFSEVETLEMDAAVMRGHDRAAGAIAGICGPRNPVHAARAVMEHSGTVFLIGRAAEDFARVAGLPFESRGYFVTERRLDALHRELARRASDAPDARSDADRHGTVGAVARDSGGNLAAATSTGGMTGKRSGRVGDTPIIGAGTFADNATCAVSTTGTGEVFIRYTAAAEIAARIRHAGQSLAQSASDVVAELSRVGGDGGLVAVGVTGAPVLPFNSSGMYRGFVDADGMIHTAIHREAYRIASA
jgi:beta-aspartyl-peptidase (threonine type)